MVVGFSHETINYLLGGLFRASYHPLNDNIINGRIRGIAGVVGCNNARTTHDERPPDADQRADQERRHRADHRLRGHGLRQGRTADPRGGGRYCGPGLAEVCETVGIPPVLHMGSCVDNSRILMAATAMVKDGGLGDDISDLPAAGAAPEWMSEKAIAIGQYFVASGVYTIFGTTFPTTGSEEVSKICSRSWRRWWGENGPLSRIRKRRPRLMIAHIDKKRKALGMDKARERVLYDMAMRRELDAV